MDVRLRKAMRRIVALMLFLTLGHEIVFALFYDTIDLDEPSWLSSMSNQELQKLPLCLGYNEETGGWGRYGMFPNCPDGYAVYAQENSTGSFFGEFEPSSVFLGAFCCKLPYDDILSSEHILNVEDECPNGFIVTGGSAEPDCGSGCNMRCTRINEEKYTLGEKTQSLHWKRSKVGGGTGGGFAKRILWDQLPLAIRFGVSRIASDHFAGDGCIGFPLGSPLVEKRGPTCDKQLHRQLRFLDGRPVPMFAPCKRFTNLTVQEPSCEL